MSEEDLKRYKDLQLAYKEAAIRHKEVCPVCNGTEMLNMAFYTNYAGTV